MNLETMRLIVTSCMPYDTGNMFMNGCRFFETEHYLMAVYDVERVPYIIYNEMGTRFSTKNQYFIQDKTIGALNQRQTEESKGIFKPISKWEDEVKRRATNINIDMGALDRL